MMDEGGERERESTENSTIENRRSVTPEESEKGKSILQMNWPDMVRRLNPRRGQETKTYPAYGSSTILKTTTCYYIILNFQIK